MRRLFLALTGIAAMLTAACSQETGGDLNPIPDPVDGKFHLTVGVENRPGVTAPSTRLAATDEERTIQDLYLLFFKPSADKSGEFVDYVRIEEGLAGPSNMNAGVEVAIDMSGTQLDVTAAYNILAVANLDATHNFTEDAGLYISGEPDRWMQQWSGKTQAEVIAEAQTYFNHNEFSGYPTSEMLLMSGITSKAENDFDSKVTLIRNNVRMDVVNKAAGYEMVGARLINHYPVSKIWNDGSDSGDLDYGPDVTRFELWHAYNDTYMELVPVLNEGGTRIGEKLEASIYTFENTVANPAQNDNITTAYIVGLKNKTTNTVGWYRFNIAAKDQGQKLVRNHAYVLTINAVLEESTDDWEDAINNPDAPDVSYIINQWNEDETGTSEQDNSSMISTPYKKINLELTTGEIRDRREHGLDPYSFKVNTVTNLTEYSDLAIIGTPKFFLNGNNPYPFSSDPNPGTAFKGMNIVLDMATRTLKFNATKIGQQVTITPTDGRAPFTHTLSAADRIVGDITLGFAGLRLTLQVEQTDLTPHNIQLYPPEGGIPTFAPFANITSDAIRVDATSEWTAEILSEYPNSFVFAESDVLSNGTLKRDPGATGYNNEIKVKTASANNDPNVAHEAFIIVSLDVDKTRYSQVLRVVQAQKTNVAITPTQGAVTFDGTYNGGAADGNRGALAAIPNNDRRTFDVLPGTQGSSESNNLKQNEWTYLIESLVPNTNSNLPGTWKTVYKEVANPDGAPQNSGIESGMTQYHWFHVWTTKPADLANLNAPNSFKVDVTGKNSSGVTRNARLVVYLKGTDPANAGAAKAVINLVQQSSGMNLRPNALPAVSKVGGETEPVTIDSDPSLRWKIESITPRYAVSGRGGGVSMAVNHPIKVVTLGGDEIASVNGTAVNIAAATYAVKDGNNANGFKVRFPKIYYPNRQIGIAVTIKVRLYDTTGSTPTELTKEITVSQSALTSPGFFPYAPQTRGYSNIHGGSYNHHYVRLLRRTADASVSTTLNVNSNYMHMNHYGLGANYDWSAARYFRENRDGLLIVNVDEDGRTAINMLNNSRSLLREWNYTVDDANRNGNGEISRTNTDTKVYKMVIEGAGGIGSVGQTSNLYVDNVSTYLSQMPATAVPLIRESNENKVLMAIDPTHNLIYQGEAQVFDTSRGDDLLHNLMIYIKNASKWGSAFADTMVDGTNAPAAPWDASWGANAGIER